MKSAIAELSPLAKRFKALAHPARLLLVRRLMENERCVSDVEKCLGLSQPNVSQHLRILKEAGIIEGRRERTRICYRIADERVARILKIALEGE
ncbi:MAG: metalloregulator ArsR/SmtB family transcription factor [Candidatus Aminicenantes bacterium]|nr:metalloregulator ArsR/SmtB family transcription factor [Candidatus Aminicenantes bacterium]